MDSAHHFTGTNAVASYGGIVPLDSMDSHWSDLFQPAGATSALANELMTATFSPLEQTVLSDTTVAVLQDLGYTTPDPSPNASFMFVDSHLLIV
jgi:hypothetical protein